MKRWLVAASIAGPIVMAAAVALRASGRGGILSAVVYAAASRICHQRPDRSFATAGVWWPVCGRCAGLYLAAPIGALAAIAGRRPRRLGHWALALAALPTALSWLVERLGLFPVTTITRAIFAVPLGAAIAFVLVRAAPDGDARPRRDPRQSA